MLAKDALGRYGEDVAARHLVDDGLDVLERNWRCELGELDIIAREGGCLVFCEVKTRRGLAYGSPAEGVGRAKAARIRVLASRWLAEHRAAWSEVRFDVVAVLAPRAGVAVVEHLRGAF